MRDLLKRLVILLGLVIISGCGHFNPPNVEVVTRLNNGAYGVYTIEGPETYYNEASWRKMEVGMFCLRPDDFGEVKKFIIEACKRAQKCELSEQQLIDIKGFMQ
jgi:hypothetical protein